MRPVAELERELERAFRRHARNGFSGSLLISGLAGGGDPAGVFARSAGWAQRGERIRCRTHTRFHCAAAAHIFSAVVILRLAELGTLDLNQPLAETLPDFPFNAQMTALHLLTHTSGLPDPFDDPQEYGQPEGMLAQAPLHALQHPRDFLPLLCAWPARWAAGERFAYNPADFLVLDILAEQAGGEPFAELLRRHVLAPAGMESAGLQRTDSLPGGVAFGYLEPGESLQTNLLALPPRGVYAAAEDWGRFWEALLGGQLLGSALVTDMLTARLASHPRPGRYSGLGVWLQGSPLPAAAVAAGNAPGAETISLRFLEQPLTLSVLSNVSGGAQPLFNDLYSLLIRNQA